MEIVSIEDNKNNIVKKDKELVHNARYRLSELGIKVVSVLVSMIKASDDDTKTYILKLSDFKHLIGSSSKKTFDYVDVLTDELMSKPFSIGNKKFNWLSYAEYHLGDDMVTVAIDQRLKPYLLGLQKNFLQYNIANILPLKSAYVIRFYELCKDHFMEGTRYKKSLKSVTFEITVDKLREQFEIPASYQYSSHIKKRILEKAIKEFEQKTDIQISYKEIKLGRKVHSLHITVRENNKGSNDYLSSRAAFIAYMRENFINVDVLGSVDKYTNRKMMISIAPDGKLYDKKGFEFEAGRSNEMWDALYNMALNDQLLCLKQGKLF